MEIQTLASHKILLLPPDMFQGLLRSLETCGDSCVYLPSAACHTNEQDSWNNDSRDVISHRLPFQLFLR
jgi:hypothetical protein